MPLSYENGFLTLQQSGKKINLAELVKKAKKPFYLYDVDGALERLRFFQKALRTTEVYFSLKCNNNEHLVRCFLERGGAGLDIVSGGELQRALELNCPAEKIVFSGVGKTKDELEKAVYHKIFQINVESIQELERLGEISQRVKTKVPLALRLNPHVRLDTHPFIQTGMGDHKFGIEESSLPHALEIFKKYPFLNFQGLAMHIGSQGISVEPILAAAEKIKTIYERLNREGFSLKTIDIGGGVGIDYRSQNLDEDLKRIKVYGDGIESIFQTSSAQIICEPGRVITARFGWLAGQVQYIKKTSTARRFVILNTGMHHLIRPVLYQAFHHVLPLKEPLAEEKKKNYTLAGPICESADVMAKDRLLPVLKSGDGLVFCDVGAYGAVMASRYNLHDWPLEIASLQGQIKGL